MLHIKWFITLQYSILRNSYWKDKNTKSRTLFGLAALITFLYALTSLINRTFFINLDSSNGYYNEFVLLLFTVVIIWVFLMSFIQSISTFTKSFYKALEMNYLVTLPIPFSKLFFFNYIKHIFISNKSLLILFIPFTSSIGLFINAPISYYILLIPVYFVITIIPSSLGVLIALIGLKMLSSRAFSFVTTIASLLINVIFAVFFTRTDVILETIYPQISTILAIPYVLDLFPITAGARLLMSLGALVSYPFSILSYIGQTVLISIICLVISNKYYFQGWERNQVVESKTIKRSNVRVQNRQLNNFGLMIHWMKGEWKMAIRNFDMFVSSFSMLSFYFLAVLAFTFGRLFHDEPMIGVAILITISTLFNIMAISLLFLPSDIGKDKSLWKSRYWILKMMPFSGKAMLLIQSMMYFIPAFGFSVIGLVMYSIAIDLNLTVFFAAIIVMLAILFGSSLLYSSTELLSLNEYFEKNAFLGNILTLVLPLVYTLLSIGLVTIFLAKDYLLNFLPMFSIINSLNFSIVVIISISILVIAVIFSYKTYTSVWHKLEI